MRVDDLMLDAIVILAAIPAGLLASWPIRAVLKAHRKKQETAVHTGTCEYLDVNAWERAKAKMSLVELERWNAMNLAESRYIGKPCDTCGGRACNCARIPSSAGIDRRNVSA